MSFWALPVAHCAAGAGIWDWAGSDDGDRDPDVVLGCAGDVVTMEVVAAAQILKEKLPQLRARGMDDVRFGELFTDHVDVVFAFHGYPGAIHQLVHGRPDSDRFHVRGFSEEGTTTTPFDMVVRNGVDRYSLVMDAINNAGRQVRGSSEVKAWCEAQLAKHQDYIVEHLEDMPQVRDWVMTTVLED